MSGPAAPLAQALEARHRSQHCRLNQPAPGTRPMNNADLIVATLKAAGIKYGFGIPSGNVLPLAEAMRLSLSEPRGPVHIDLPEDVALASTNEAVPAVGTPARVAPATDQAVAKAGDLIATARRPIAVIGSSAMRMRDPNLLLQV